MRTKIQQVANHSPADNPWAVGPQRASRGDYVTAYDRVEQIRQSQDVSWLLRVLKYPDNQASVIQAAERRLLALNRKHYLQ